MGWKPGKHQREQGVVVRMPVEKAMGGAPDARSEGLVVEELDQELLVYDRDADQAHCLASKAAAVWRRCNGKAAPAEIARQLDLPLAEVNQAVTELDECGLLTGPGGVKVGLSRRDFGIKSAKTAVAVGTLPLILSVAAPAAADTASAIAACRMIGTVQGCSGCKGGAQCCCCDPGGGSIKTCSSSDAQCKLDRGASANCTG